MNRLHENGLSERHPRFAVAFPCAWLTMAFVMPACTSKFDSCADTRSCPPPGSGGDTSGRTNDAGGDAASGGSGGDLDGGEGSVRSPEAEAAPPPCSTVEGGITSDPDHCGSCSVACSATGASERHCEQGVCKPTCDTAHLDCDKDGKNGCEVDSENDPDNCGACLYACSSAAASERKCSAGKCAPVCSSGRGDCSAPAPAPDDGCETSLTTATDCGACGHDCLGGACSAQKCQELSLATGLPQPLSVTVDSNYVHWIDGTVDPGVGRVVRTSLFGQGTTPMTTNEANPQDIVSDGKYVFWTNLQDLSSGPDNGAIRRIVSGGIATTPIDVATPERFFGAVAAPGAIALDSNYVYWANTGGGLSSIGIYMMRKDGTGSPNQVNVTAPTNTVWDIAVDTTNVFFVTGGRLFRSPNDGSADQMNLGDGGYAVALDDTYAFTEGRGAIAEIAKTASNGQSAIPGSDVTSSVRAIAADKDYVYYGQSDGLYRIPKAGGTREQLSTSVDNVRGMVVTGGALYWVNVGDINGSTGSVLKLAL